MSYCCTNALNGLYCSCTKPFGLSTGCTTHCPDGETCETIYSSDCILYTGPDIDCYGITNGMSITEIVEILISYFPSCTDVNNPLFFDKAWEICLAGPPITTSTCNAACNGYDPIECVKFYTAPLCAKELQVDCILYDDDQYVTQSAWASGFYSDGVHCYEILNGVVTEVLNCPPATTTTTTIRVITDCTGITCVRPPVQVNGNLITSTYTGTSVFQAVPLQGWFSCSTLMDENFWLGFDGTPFTYTIHFSNPVNNVRLLLGVMGRYEDEVFTFTTSSGNPTITVNSSCYASVVGNQIIGGNTTVTNGGGGEFTFTTGSPYTSLTISGNGSTPQQGGTLFGIVCSSI